MSVTCAKCGASLSESQMFCTSCGTRQSQSAPASPAPRFCTRCGGPLESGFEFCTKCGASAAGAAASNQPSQPASLLAAAHMLATQTPTSPSQPVIKKPRSLAVKLFFAAAGFLFLVALAFGAGLAYLGYRTRKKVEVVRQAYKHDDLAGMIGAVTGKNSSPQPLPDWKPVPSNLVSSPAGKIPLRASLRLIFAGNDPLRGDFESIFVLDSITDQVVHIHGSQQFPAGQGLEGLLEGKSKKPQLPHKIECGRAILRADMEDSAEEDGYFCREGREEKHPGTTAMGFSKKTLNELRTAGQAEFTFHEDPLKALFKSFKNAASGSASTSDDFLKKIMDMAPGGGGGSINTPPVKCTLHREGTADVAFPVLINDQPVELPAMHVSCKSPDSEDEGHIYVLDDLGNPQVLAGMSKSGGRDQIIKIYWNTANDSAGGGSGSGGRSGSSASGGAGGGSGSEGGASRLAQELEKNGRAKVYDIYFDFRSDVLRPESKKVLDEIAQVMRERPDWRLGVEGHTDNIGGNAFNQDLSSRRAAAVKQALVSGYHLDHSRFSTAGIGSSRPVASNDTMEGRALNRRVELVRE